MVEQFCSKTSQEWKPSQTYLEWVRDIATARINVMYPSPEKEQRLAKAEEDPQNVGSILRAAELSEQALDSYLVIQMTTRHDTRTVGEACAKGTDMYGTL